MQVVEGKYEDGFSYKEIYCGLLNISYRYTHSIMQLLTELKKSYLSYECSAPFYVSGLAVLLFHQADATARIKQNETILSK